MKNVAQYVYFKIHSLLFCCCRIPPIWTENIGILLRAVTSKSKFCHTHL